MIKVGAQQGEGVGIWAASNLNYSVSVFQKMYCHASQDLGATLLALSLQNVLLKLL